MKKTLTLVLCVLLSVLCTVSMFAVSTGKNVGTVGGTSQTVTLDGKKDAAYSDGMKIDGSTVQTKGGNGAASATYYVTYTKDALWIYCEIIDATLEVKNKDEKKPSYAVDSIEIMLDPDNKGANEADKSPYQMRIDSFNLVSARKGQKGTSLFLRKSEGGTCDFFEAQSVKTANGFNAEYKIPLSDLKAGKQIGFNFCYNDWDKTGATRVTLGTDKDATSWQPEKYQYFTLGEIKVATTAAATTKAAATATKTTTAAAKTADMSVVIAAVATVALAGVVVCKKKH